MKEVSDQRSNTLHRLFFNSEGQCNIRFGVPFGSHCRIRLCFAPRQPVSASVALLSYFIRIIIVRMLLNTGTRKPQKPLVSCASCRRANVCFLTHTIIACLSSFFIVNMGIMSLVAFPFIPQNIYRSAFARKISLVRFLGIFFSFLGTTGRLIPVQVQRLVNPTSDTTGAGRAAGPVVGPTL
jgi:hypothetical protein